MQHDFDEDTMLCKNCRLEYSDKTAGETCNGLVEDIYTFLESE